MTGIQELIQIQRNVRKVTSYRKLVKKYSLPSILFMYINQEGNCNNSNRL